MAPGVPAKVIAASMGLVAFAVALISGLAVDNPAEEILVRGMICMVACNAIGWLLGAVAERVVADHVRTYQDARPVPDFDPSPGVAQPETPQTNAQLP